MTDRYRLPELSSSDLWSLTLAVELGRQIIEHRAKHSPEPADRQAWSSYLASLDRAISRCTPSPATAAPAAHLLPENVVPFRGSSHG